MNVIPTEVLDVYILEPKVFGDHRGWFMETWSTRNMEEAGLHYDFVQDNQSYSAKKERCEASIFKRVTLPRQSWCAAGRGAVLDVAVDLRKGSPTYKKWVAVELSAENKRQLLIPRGFGHGFVTLTDDVEFLYKEDNLYNPSTDRNILWNDPELGIDWRVENPILSEKDQRAPLLHDSDVDFVYKEK